MRMRTTYFNELYTITHAPYSQVRLMVRKIRYSLITIDCTICRFYCKITNINMASPCRKKLFPSKKFVVSEDSSSPVDNSDLDIDFQPVLFSSSSNDDNETIVSPSKLPKRVGSLIFCFVNSVELTTYKMLLFYFAAY